MAAETGIQYFQALLDARLLRAGMTMITTNILRKVLVFSRAVFTGTVCTASGDKN
jgi:hypothetical protein